MIPRLRPGTMCDVAYQRDPVSERFDAAARRLLARAYARPNQWVGTRLADPGVRARQFAAARGIDLGAADKGGSAIGGSRGGLNARTRWARAFVRSLYFCHKYSGRAGRPIQVEVGRHIPASPQFDPRNPSAGGFPAGRAVRVKYGQGGKSRERAVRRLADRDRIYADDGSQGRRWADPVRRDWDAWA